MSAAPNVTVLTLTREELCEIVRQAVRSELAGQAANDNDVITREKAASILDIHPKTLIKYVEKRGLPGMFIGGAWKFRRSDIEKWLEEQVVQPGAPIEAYARKLRALKRGD